MGYAVSPNNGQLPKHYSDFIAAAVRPPNNVTLIDKIV